jgi:WD40 repeat protein
VSIELRKIDADHYQTNVEKPFPAPLKSIRDMAFSSYGHRLAIATGDTTAYVWDLETNNVEGLLHKVPVSAVAFAPNEPGFVMTRSTQTVHVWRCADKTEIARISQNSLLNEAVFTTDGRYLITLASNGGATKHLWRTADLLAHACERLGENAPEPCKTIGGHYLLQPAESKPPICIK